MKYPYLITSDQHCHSWSEFSRPEGDGVNSRLRLILEELVRAHGVLALEGGTHSFYAGDLFHVRGKIEPSVFNPTFETIRTLHELADLRTHAIPGNHDLEGNDATELGNAMQQLGTIPNFHVHTTPSLVGDVLVIPWIKDLAHLRDVLGSYTVGDRAKTDVIIHAPVNGVLKGIPDHGLNADELAAFGFRRVFSGHYHDHKVMADGKVFSVGATTHQTWSDPGTKAGFLLVYEDRVEYYESKAPQFIDLNPEFIDSAEEAVEYCNGNYVRMKLVDVEPKDVRGWREELLKVGAVGIKIIEVKTASVTRSGASTKAAISLEASVQHYIENDQKPMLLDEVSKMAMEVLAEARA